MEARRSVYTMHLIGPPKNEEEEVVRSELEEIKWVSLAAVIELGEELVVRD
jgi:hypothetical protein